MIVVVFQRCIL